jgi:hypothetical protein
MNWGGARRFSGRAMLTWIGRGLRPGLVKYVARNRQARLPCFLLSLVGAGVLTIPRPCISSTLRPGRSADASGLINQAGNVPSSAAGSDRRPRDARKSSSFGRWSVSASKPRVAFCRHLQRCLPLPLASPSGANSSTFRRSSANTGLHCGGICNSLRRTRRAFGRRAMLCR